MKTLQIILLLFFPLGVLSQSSPTVLISQDKDSDNIVWKDGKFKLIESKNLDSLGIFDPYFLTINDIGNIVLMDWGQRSLFYFMNNKIGNPIKIGGNKGRGPGEYETPLDIYLTNNGEIWVPDTELRKIDVWDSKTNQLEKTFKIENRFVKPDKITFCENSDGDFDRLYILSSQYGYGFKKEEGILHQYDIEEGRLEILNTFQKLTEDDERYPYVVTGHINCSDKNELFYTSDFSGTIRKYDIDNQLVFYRNTAGFEVKEPLFIKVREDFTRYNPEAPRINGESFLNGDKILVGHSRAKDRYVYGIDIYSERDGKYMHSIKLPVPAKEMAIHGNELYLLEYAGDFGFNLKVYEFDISL